MVTIFFYPRAHAVCGVRVMNGPDRYDAGLDIDIASLFVSLWRAKGRILAGSLIFSGLAYAAAISVTPKYNSATRIFIDRTESVFTRPGQDKVDDKPILDQEAIKSQVELIGANDVLRKVMIDNKLADNPEFDPAQHISYAKWALIVLGLINDPNGMQEEERTIAQLRKKLKVYSVENSRIIVVEFSSENRELAAKIPNEIAAEYLAVQRQAKSQSNSDATKWLEPEIDALRIKVRDAEEKVATYRSQSDLLIGQNNSVLATQQLAELSTELSRVRANRANAEAKASSVRSALEGGASIDTLPEVISSNLIQRLRERQVQLKSEIADLSTTLLDGHPRIKALRSQLTNLQKQIASEARNILDSLEGETKTAALRERELVKDLNGLKVESGRAGDEGVELKALESEADSQRLLLDSYLTRYREAKSRNDRGYEPTDARIVSPAQVPGEPYFPKKIPIVSAAFAGSLLLLSLITMLRELFSGRAFKPAAGARFIEESELAPQATMNVAAAAAAPEAEPAPEKRAEPSLMSFSPEGKPAPPPAPEPDPEHSIKAITDRLVEKGASRAIIVSPEGDEAAASAVLIVRELADRGLRSILLDLTSTGSASHPMIDGFALPGITNLLASQAQFRDIIHSDPYSGAHVIPNGTAEPSQAMRAVERLPIILNALTTAYDTVVVECGPADPKGIARLVTPGSEIIMSVINPDDASIVKSAAALHDAGYEDILLVTPVGSMPLTPEPDRSALRRA
jgi:uncharacterized protein involved in exopolysaccharide biosynthesis/Mrp family chromosome partitioning ATPase